MDYCIFRFTPHTSNHHHTKNDVFPKTFLQIILAVKWLVRHIQLLPSTSSDDLCLFFCIYPSSTLYSVSGPISELCRGPGVYIQAQHYTYCVGPGAYIQAQQYIYCIVPGVYIQAQQYTVQAHGCILYSISRHSSLMCTVQVKFDISRPSSIQCRPRYIYLGLALCCVGPGVYIQTQQYTVQAQVNIYGPSSILCRPRCIYLGLAVHILCRPRCIYLGLAVYCVGLGVYIYAQQYTVQAQVYISRPSSILCRPRCVRPVGFVRV